MGRPGDGRRLVVVAAVFIAALSTAIWIGQLPITLPQRTALILPGADDDLTTGSILLMPQRGDDCWQKFVDNLTGKVWDYGSVSCDAALSSRPAGTAAANPRLEAIAKGFRGD